MPITYIRPLSRQMAMRRMAGLLPAAAVLALSIPAPGSSWAEPPADGVLKGSIIKTNRHNANPTINENDIRKIEPGATLDMTISTAVTPGVNMEGDEFFGTVSQDYTVDGKVVIPRGAIVHGSVEKLQAPRRAGRNGYIRTRFDYLIMPDGREISINGGSTTQDSKAKAALKVAGRTTGYTLVGGVVGAVMVMKYGGLAAVAASNGYALAGGAAIGGAAGLTAAMLTHGQSALLQPGAEIQVKLNDKLALPTMNMPDAAAENYAPNGLNVKVLGMRLDKDPFGEPNEITLTLDINNKTENTFSTFEIALEDEYGNVFYPSPFGDTGMWFSKITPNSHASSNITFNVDNIRARHKLVFYRQYTREALAKIALTDAMVTGGKAVPKKHTHS